MFIRGLQIHFYQQSDDGAQAQGDEGRQQSGQLEEGGPDAPEAAGGEPEPGKSGEEIISPLREYVFVMT